MIPPRLRRGDPIGKLVDHWNMLIDHLNEIRIVAGSGISVTKMPAGTVIKAGSYRGTSGTSGSPGLFQVTIDKEKQLVIGKGFVNRNGLEMSEYPGGKVEPANGYLCICSEPSDKQGNWTQTEAMIKDQPNQCAYPIAKITVSGESVFIEQYPVVVAQIFYSGRCPIAEL